VFGLHVANTIGTGIIDPSVVDATVIFAALVGAIVWNLITWGLGIPSSSSHALIGGLVGAGVAKAGLCGGGLERPDQDAAGDRAVAAGWIPAGAGAGRGGFLAIGALDPVCGRPAPSESCNSSRPRSIRSAMGGNDAQKTMGIIAVLLYSQGHLGEHFSIPFWVVLACQLRWRWAR